MATQTTLDNVRLTAVTVADDIRDLVKGKARRDKPALDARQQSALAALRRDGFAVVEEYWDPERTQRVREALESAMGEGGDIDFPEGAYQRTWEDRAYDSGVRRIWHVEKLLPELGETRFDPLVLQIAEAYYGIPFYSGALVFQHNLRTNKETRYHHVDGFTREFKAFLYLEDVDKGNGPFTYIRGTHKSHLLRLRKQIVGNREGSPTSFYPEDLKGSLDDEVMIEGKAGTLILADVRGLHRGSPQQDGSRSVLVNYILKHPGDLHMDR
jgi:phytanoyl-CoA dioxygenase PhyH